MYGASNFIPIHLLVRFSRYSRKEDRLGVAMCQVLSLHSVGTMETKTDRWALEFSTEDSATVVWVHAGAVGICIAATLAQQARCFSLTCVFSSVTLGAPWPKSRRAPCWSGHETYSWAGGK